VARRSEFSPISGTLGNGATPEEALADLREARRGLIALMLERGDPVPELPPVRVDARA
jgi:predicted RNase H-like HicB family nuclease